MEWEVTKVKHPNKGHTLNNGQRPMYQGVRYLESPLYTVINILNYSYPSMCMCLREREGLEMTLVNCFPDGD